MTLLAVLAELALTLAAVVAGSAIGTVAALMFARWEQSKRGGL